MRRAKEVKITKISNKMLLFVFNFQDGRLVQVYRLRKHDVKPAQQLEIRQTLLPAGGIF